MKITDVEVIPVKGRHWPRFPMVFVEVHTDEGLTGIGAALGNPRVIAAIVDYELAPEVVGEDPLFSERIFEKLYNNPTERSF